MIICLSCSTNWVDISKALTSQLLVEKIKLCIKLGQRVYFALRLSKGVKFRKRRNIQEILRNENFLILFLSEIKRLYFMVLGKFISLLREIPRKNSRVFYKIPGYEFFSRVFPGFQGFPGSVDTLILIHFVFEHFPLLFSLWGTIFTFCCHLPSRPQCGHRQR